MDAVQIANMALSQIGVQASISSVTVSDGSAEGNAVVQLFQPLMDNLMSSAHWNFARWQTTLSYLKAAAGTPENPAGATPSPPRPWLYTYAHPSDCLKARFLIPAAQTTSIGIPFTTADNYASPTVMDGAIKFIVAADSILPTPSTGSTYQQVIMTYAATPDLVYTRRIDDVTQWSDTFVMAAIAYLGAWLVNPLARNRALWGDQMKMANDAIAQARVTNGNEGPVTMDHVPDWMRIRGVSPMNHGRFYYGWSNIAWPDGSLF